MRIAAAAYPLDFLPDFAAYEAKLTDWVGRAVAQGADLLVFPEYGAMELASLGGAEVAGDLERALHEVARWRGAVDALHLRLAAAHGVHILGASGPVFPVQGARPVNRATLYGPGGTLGHQDKQMMTRFERETWFVVPGEGLRVFDTPLGKLGVLICYDSEFPLLARRLAEAGAEVLLVPSCTDSVARGSRGSGWGRWRGRWRTSASRCRRRRWGWRHGARRWTRMWGARRSMVRRTGASRRTGCWRRLR